MPPDIADDDRPLRPPEPAGVSSLLTWVVALALALALVLGAFQAYRWWLDAPPHEAGAAEAQAPAPAQPTESPQAGPEGKGAHSCFVNGKWMRTEGRCPLGSERPAAATPARADLPLPAPPPGEVDSGPRGAWCAYLLAEITRLDFEFKQNLPPPVLDRISTRLHTLRARNADGGCPAPPREADLRPPGKVLNEKGSG